MSTKQISRYEHDAIQSVVEGVDEAARRSEDKWGVGRLELLVGDELREKFRRQQRRLTRPLKSQDVEQVRSAGGAMRRGWEVLSQAATEAGAEPLSPEVWEIAMTDGRVVALCRNQADAYHAFRAGRHADVWTLEEVKRLIEAWPEIALAKQTFPGAEVVSARMRASPEARQED
jgi:hypothetical protein